MKKRKMKDYWNMGIAIVLCVGVGIVIGALLHNVVLWLCIGAYAGVILGAVCTINSHKKTNTKKGSQKDE